jgi:uncharacterized membrane protein
MVVHLFFALTVSIMDEGFSESNLAAIVSSFEEQVAVSGYTYYPMFFLSCTVWMELFAPYNKTWS